MKRAVILSALLLSAFLGRLSAQGPDVARCYAEGALVGQQMQAEEVTEPEAVPAYCGGGLVYPEGA